MSESSGELEDVGRHMSVRQKDCKMSDDTCQNAKRTL